MQEEILTLALILLISTHAMLIRKCFNIEAQVPSFTEQFHAKTDSLEETVGHVRDLLDEALDMMNDLPSPSAPLMAEAGHAESIPAMILSTLLSRVQMPPADGPKTEPQQWEIFPPNDDPTTKEDDQPLNGGSTILDR